jgi:hypothetical protein
MDLVILIIGLAVVGSLYIYGEKAGIMPIPTLPKVRGAMLSLVPSSAKSIAELGSGWGGLAAALQRKGIRVTAFEISPLPRFMSRLRGVKAINADFMKADLSGFDTIICYLSPKHMTILKPKFEAELKPGTTIISNAFPIPDWTSQQMVTLKGFPDITVYAYMKT